MFNGQIFIEKDNIEVYRTKNNIHPQFLTNIASWLVGDVSQTFVNSANWIIDRFYFYSNEIDNISNLSNTGINIGTKTSVSFSSSNNVLTVKISYSAAGTFFINSFALANQYQFYSYANVKSVNTKQDFIYVQTGENITFGWQLDFNDLGRNINLSDSIKRELISLISTGYFNDNTGSTLSSLSSNRISSLRENGFIVAHTTVNDAINNKLSYVGNSNRNDFLNSSIFFNDRSRNVYRTDNIIWFEQFLYNDSNSVYIVNAVSLLKNPIVYKSIVYNGEFEETAKRFSPDDASGSFVSKSSIYSTDTTLLVTATASSGNRVVSALNTNSDWFSTSALSGQFELSYMTKADSANIRGGVNYTLNQSPFTTYASGVVNNTPLIWTEYTITGSNNGTSASKLSMFGGTGIGESVYIDKVRLRPYPLFNTTSNIGTQICFIKLGTPVSVQPGQIFKMTWKLDLQGTSTVTTNIPQPTESTV